MKATPAPIAVSRERRSRVVFDAIRFAVGVVFIVMGAGLLLEGAVGSRLFLEGVNRVFEFYVGLMSVALGGLLIAGMSKESDGV